MTNPPTQIRFNLLPAELNIQRTEEDTSEFLPKTRVIVGADAVYVFADGPNGPEEVYSARVDDFYGNAKVGYTIEASNGDILTFKRSEGCLCGSRLRGFDPYRGVPYISFRPRDPSE